jgi:hypothetical protein
MEAKLTNVKRVLLLPVPPRTTAWPKWISRVAWDTWGVTIQLLHMLFTGWVVYEFNPSHQSFTIMI